MPTYLLEFSRDDLSDTTPTWIGLTPCFLWNRDLRSSGLATRA
jgi:hypothetical protein